MTVRQFEGPVFEQSEISAMRRALAQSCAVLEFNCGGRKVGSEFRELLAVAILKSAETGETDPLRLSAAALRQTLPMAPIASRGSYRKTNSPAGLVSV
jgi:hypothetical protein